MLELLGAVFRTCFTFKVNDEVDVEVSYLFSYLFKKSH